MNKKVFLCEPTADGILTGVFDAWASGLGHENVRLETEGDWEPELFVSWEAVPTDSQKAERVARALRRELGQACWEQIFRAALSDGADRADAVYRTVVLGLSEARLSAAGKKGAGAAAALVLEKLQDPHVCRVWELARRTGREAHHYYGFLRFRELAGGILFAEIRPRARVLPLIGDHFADRYPAENFLISDLAHSVRLLHRAGYPWVLMQGAAPDAAAAGAVSGQEEEYRRLWQTFLDAVAIQERSSPKLRDSLLPKRYRPYMAERL